MLKSTKSLDGEWRLYYAPNAEIRDLCPRIVDEESAKKYVKDSVAGTVPGNFELDLMREHKFFFTPDFEPYLGQNVLRFQELENLHLFYCRKFRVDEKPNKNTFLHFEGIDTVSEIYINGKLMLKTSNMSLPYEIPATDFNVGENEILVHIIPAVIASREFDIPVSSHAQFYNYESLYIRKAASMFGWDIMPRIVSGGIWKSVSLIEKKPDRLDDVYLYTTELKDGGAFVTAYFTLHTERDFLNGFKIRVSGKCGDSEFSYEETPRHTNGRLYFFVKDAKLWFPRPVGDPNLYETKIELFDGDKVIDTVEKRLGIRTIKLSRTGTTDENESGDFCFVVNGVRVFVNGTNWVPLCPFHSKDYERIDRTFEMVTDLGCNMLRMWGGNVYEDERVFDLCDENGVMIWQDFGMGCAAYPQDETFLKMLEPEIIHVIRKYRGHAALALWAGDNECDIGIEWAGSRDRDPNGNVVTRKLLPELVRIHDFPRDFLPSSPYVDEEAFKTKKPTSEAHLWGPRIYFKDGFYLAPPNLYCHFASEIGYHGCPSPASVRKFITKDQVWPIFGPGGVAGFERDGVLGLDWIVHATSIRASGDDPYAYRIRMMGNQVEILFTRKPESIEEFAKMSQISQAEANKFFIEHFRIRPHRHGLIWWNLIDGWPEVSDAVVDHYYVKKAAYYYTKRSQAPLLLAFDEPQDGKIALYAVNDTRVKEKVKYNVRCLTDGRENLLSGDVYAPGLTATKLGELEISDGEQKFYYIEWETESGIRGKNHYFTNIIHIDYESYLKDLKAAGMDIFEGFEE